MTKIETNKPHPYVFPAPKVDHLTKSSSLAQYPKDIDEKRTEMLEENLAKNKPKTKEAKLSTRIEPEIDKHLDRLA